jgi:hypothetical protein
MRLVLASLALTVAACSAGGTYHPFGDLSMGGGDLAGRDLASTCGQVGEQCCPGNVCAMGSCMNGVCTVSPGCGHIGMSCCTMGTACTDANSVCQNGTCVQSGNCGKSGEPCCNGACTDGTSVCQNGTCVTQQCGHLGQQCCNGVSCSDPGTQCQGGFCASCGGIGQQCCNGITCTQGVCQGGVCGQAATDPVGHTCTSSTMCTGTSPQCVTTIPMTTIMAPGGYCTNANCVSNASCGTGGFCDTMYTHSCLQDCANPGDCNANNGNNACFFWTNTNAACLPRTLSKCDPTVIASCAGANGCLREGIDNVGDCFPTCVFGGVACPNDQQGQAQGCYYFNSTVDSNGNPTTDKFNGLMCLPLGTSAVNTACMFLDDCVSGYECDQFMAGGTKVCRQMCKLGTTVCSTGSCKDAFKLGASFINGAIGLCF